MMTKILELWISAKGWRKFYNHQEETIMLYIESHFNDENLDGLKWKCRGGKKTPNVNRKKTQKEYPQFLKSKQDERSKKQT